MASALNVLRHQVAPHSRYVAPIMLALMAVVVVLLSANALRFSANLTLSQAAVSDNQVWTTSQLEVDHKNLLLALSDARDGTLGASSDKLAVAFDIFYSRVDILSTALEHGDLPSSLRGCLELVINSRDALALQFDRLNTADPMALAGFAAEVESLSPLFRKTTLESLSYFIDFANSSRKSEVMLWKWFLMISLVLIGLMATAMCFALLLRHQLANQIELVQSASDNIRMVYEASMLAVVVTDTFGKILLFNPAAEQIFDCDAAEMLGRNVADTMIPPHRLGRHLSAMKRRQEGDTEALLTRKPILTTTLDKKRREFPIELSVHASQDNNGDTLLIAFIRDASEQCAYENHLREARDEARRQAESRTMFLATMSHEMRTPLHGLLASLELINVSEQSPEVRRLLSTAHDCALRSVSQINDVLNLIQIDDAQESPTPFTPSKVVASIVAELEALAQERSNTTQIRLTGAAESQQWLGAANIFTKVLYNLIGNALKFTKNGSVQIELAHQHDPVNGHRLFVAVQDSGIGIASEDQANIFEMFFTSALSGAKQRQEGTGLGLPIARKGVEKMGGELHLKSTLGKGSRFYFEIPLGAVVPFAVPGCAQRLCNQPKHFDLTCLIVDDNLVNLELITQMLRQLGCKVQAYDNGASAVAATALTHFDVIFMDINMPGGMSGGEASRHIRNLEKIDPNRSAKSFIVAITADSTFGSPSSLAEQSMDCVLHKPFSSKHLIRVLANFKPQPYETVQDQVGFAELYLLMGPVDAKRLVEGVVSDIRLLQNALANDSNPQLEHLLHRAIGSTAMVGLTSLSVTLSEAIQKLRQQGQLGNDSSAIFIACDLGIDILQKDAA